MDPYEEHFTSQAGGNFDYRIGPVYRGSFVRQRGRGFASIFRNALSFVTPLFKSGAQALGRAALSTGANIASDIAASDGSPISIKEIAKRRVLETRDNIVKKMRGSGRKRRRMSNKRKIPATRIKSRRDVKRRGRRTKADIFSGL